MKKSITRLKFKNKVQRIYAIKSKFYYTNVTKFLINILLKRIKQNTSYIHVKKLFSINFTDIFYDYLLIDFKNTKHETIKSFHKLVRARKGKKYNLY